MFKEIFNLGHCWIACTICTETLPNWSQTMARTSIDILNTAFHYNGRPSSGNHPKLSSQHRPSYPFPLRGVAGTEHSSIHPWRTQGIYFGFPYISYSFTFHFIILGLPKFAAVTLLLRLCFTDSQPTLQEGVMAHAMCWPDQGLEGLYFVRYSEI